MNSYISNIALLDATGNEVKGKKVSVESTIELPVDRAWQELQKGALLRYISDDITKFGELPEVWKVGEEVKTLVKAKLFGLIPMSGNNPYSITFSEINHDNHSAETQENGSGVLIWNHSMKMTSLGDTTTRYTDTIDIYAGRLTGIISMHSNILYKHRHERWKKVAEILNSGNTMDDTYKTVPQINT